MVLTMRGFFGGVDAAGLLSRFGATCFMVETILGFSAGPADESEAGEGAGGSGGRRLVQREVTAGAEASATLETAFA